MSWRKATNNPRHSEPWKVSESYNFCLLVKFTFDCGSTSDTTSTSGSNETDFLTSWCISSDCRRVTNMLMVTSSVRMVHRVHCDTSNLRPGVSLDTVFVVSVTGLQHRFVDSSSTSNNSDHSSRVTWDNLFGSGWEFDSCGTFFSVVTDDGSIVFRNNEQSNHDRQA